MALPVMPVILACLAFSTSLHVVSASAFRGRLSEDVTVMPVGPELQKALLGEIERVLGGDHRRATEGRLGRIEAALESTYAALPRNVNGRLGHAAVRYAMHRHFLQKHAWFVRGLEPGGDAWNASSPTAILQDRLPEYVQTLFEDRVGDRGFDLHELAVLAATLENLVHRETMQRLESTYMALERSPEDPLSVEESHEVIDAYMASYVMGLNFTTLSPEKMRKLQKRVTEVYPTWPDTQKWVREVHASVAPQRDELTLENIGSIIEEIGERYGHWQDAECRTLKNELVALEDRGTGRVRLADFYGAAVNDGKWQFSEGVAYLRQLGALDESDPNNLRVIIPNYIMSPSNCVASSSYYSVCCLDECEEILSHLEEKLGTHDATPGEIISLVAFLSSATVAGNRTISNALRERLEDVSQHHGGRIPLHGRLFAQWMHHAYPRECPFPHITGTTRPQRANEYMAQSGQRLSASEEEMRQHAEHRRPRSEEVAEDYGMWSMEEELVVRHEAPTLAEVSSRTASFLRTFMFAALAVSIVVSLFTMGTSILKGTNRDLLPKHCHNKYSV